MNSALEGRLAVGALTLVLAVVLASCSGGGQAGPLQAENPPAQLKLLPQENRPLARPLAAGGSTAPLHPQPLRCRRVPPVERSRPSLSRRLR
jgi:hypothetical protein